jgi:hypothetical protein
MYLIKQESQSSRVDSVEKMERIFRSSLIFHTCLVHPDTLVERDLATTSYIRLHDRHAYRWSNTRGYYSAFSTYTDRPANFKEINSNVIKSKEINMPGHNDFTMTKCNVCTYVCEGVLVGFTQVPTFLCNDRIQDHLNTTHLVVYSGVMIAHPGKVNPSMKKTANCHRRFMRLFRESLLRRGRKAANIRVS